MSEQDASAASTSNSIYRYKLTEDVMSMITKYSKIHEYDDRVTYKEAWNIWFDDNQEILNGEINRLVDLGYKGCVKDKMYKAGRYYFRKKNVNKEKGKLIKEKQKRRSYISMDLTILDAMDEHISHSMRNSDFTPANGYNEFCKEHVDLLKNVIRVICEGNKITADDIICKIKKTYKNRYFLLSRIKLE